MLTLPTHCSYGIVVLLPYPRSVVYTLRTEGESDAKKDTITIEELARYMSLSCNIEVFLSSLCAMFWNESVSCNLVSPWLHPILNEVPLSPDMKDIPGYYHEVLCYMCARRCPSIYPLWVGAAISGLLPRVISLVGTGMPVLDSVAFPWTGCPQSFMDFTRPGQYYDGQREEISRADAWQICYLPSLTDDDLHYQSRPLVPWKPPGKTHRRNCALRVQVHWYCERHELRYQSWSWELTDGRVKFDIGDAYDKGVSPRVPESLIQGQPEFATLIKSMACDQTASRNASQAISQWSTINHEGIPQEKVYHDEWLDGFLQDDDDSTLSQSPPLSSPLESIPLYDEHSTTSNSGGIKQQIVDKWFDSMNV